MNAFILLVFAPFACVQEPDEDPVPTVEVIGERIGNLETEPVSGTLLEGEDLERRRLHSPGDIASVAPNLAATDTGTRNFGDVFTMRGMASTPFFSNPAVTFYVDDIPFGDVFSYAHRLEGVETVEVLRGPQHTLFGRYGYGGVINVTSRRPGERVEGTIFGAWGTQELFETGVAVRGPVVEEQLSFRVAAGLDRRDGFLENTFLGLDPDGQERFGGNAAVYWTPGKNWDVSLTVAGEKYDDGAPRLNSLFAPDPYEVASDVEGRMIRRTNMQALRIGYRADAFEVLSVTARREWDLNPYEFDLDFSPLPLGSVKIIQDQQIVSQEIRVRSCCDQQWDWLAGVYGHVEKTDHEGLRTFFPFSSRTRYSVDETWYALFGQAGYRAIEDWRFHVGLRWDHVDGDLDRRATGGFGPPSVLDLSGDTSRATGKVGADHRVNEDIVVYTSAAYAFKPGGFSGFSSDPRFAEFDDERAWVVEAGAKAAFGEGRVRAAAALFYSRIRDYQVERFFTLTDYTVFNADRVTSFGGELEVAVQVCPKLKVHGAAGLTHAEFDDYTDPVTGADFSGNTPPFVPDFDAMIGAHATPYGDLFARIEAVGKGKIFFDDANRDLYEEDAYGVLNISVGLEGENYQLMLFGTNLTDKFYITNMNTEIAAGVPSIPRVLGASLRFRF